MGSQSRQPTGQAQESGAANRQKNSQKHQEGAREEGHGVRHARAMPAPELRIEPGAPGPHAYLGGWVWAGRMPETVVISIGGSIVAPPNLDVTYIDSLAKLLVELSKQRKIYCVTGGGWIARQYITAAREFGAGEEELDLIGIAATRINAQLLIAALTKYTEVPVRPMASVEATVESSQGYNISIMGGTFPGHSTDYVGAELAARAGAVRFINATNVDGVYSADPNVVPTAEFYKELNIDALIKMMGTEWKMAGAKSVIDGPACALIKKHRLHTVVVNGKNLPELARAIRGDPFHGTTITFPPATPAAAPAPMAQKK